MKEKEEIDYLEKHSGNAGNFFPQKKVVPLKRALAAVQRAYVKGYKAAIG